VRSVRTVCATCGSIEVALDDARLVVTAGADGSAAAVEFSCPRCHRPGSQPVGERGVALLTAAGIGLAAAESPAELASAGDDPDRSGGAN
jgi:hypothetical protein